MAKRKKTPPAPPPDRAALKSLNDLLMRNVTRYRDNYHRFRQVFGVPLKPFWESNLLGFDAIKFDEELVQPADGESTYDAVLRRWGQAGVDIVKDLIGKGPENKNDQVSEAAEGQPSV